MSYQNAVFNEPTSPTERINRLYTEINALSRVELEELQDRLNPHTSTSSLDKGNSISEPKLSLNGICVRVLSRREIDVLTLVAAGYSRREIGVSLTITSNTAAKHVSSIYRKLNISSIAEATRIALENGIIASELRYR